MAKSFDLTNKTALVTGAGQGLGKTFALALANAGAEVYILARNIDRLTNTADEIMQKTASEVYPVQVDITDEASVMAACAAISQKSGKIDILVNNAAVGRSNSRLEDETLESWNSIINTNLTGTFLMMKHVGKIMIQQKSGKIINLASMTGKVSVRNPSVGAYEVSKAAVEALSRTMAGAWAEHNITVNSICPGYYMTDINKAYIEENIEFYEDSLTQIPLKSWGDPDEIGDTVVFLASTASNYMTGANIVIDGGYTIW